MSSWPYVVVLLLTIRCLYWGIFLHPQNVKLTWCMTVNVKLTLHSIALDHQMHGAGGMSDCPLHSEIACFRMSWWPNIVLLVATRCLYQGVVCILKMSSWPYVVVLLLTIRCLYWGIFLHPQNVKLTWRMTVNVKLTLHSTALDHQMPLLGDTSDCPLHSQLHSSECQDYLR